MKAETYNKAARIMTNALILCNTEMRLIKSLYRLPYYLIKNRSSAISFDTLFVGFAASSERI